MRAVLGVDAVFHDLAAALVVDGEIVDAVEEGFTPREHGKRPVPVHQIAVHLLCRASDAEVLARPADPARPWLAGEDRS